MDRLTKHTPDNSGYTEYELKLGADEDDVISRLGAYEDTGLTPKEINALQEAHDFYDSNDCLASRRLIELALADRDGRVVILPKPLTTDDVEAIRDIGRIVNNLNDMEGL